MSEFDASWVARLVREFDLSGVHRASTPGDYASGEWLCSQAREGGVEISKMHVDLPRTVVDEAFVELAGQRIDGLPMFDSAPVARIRGTLGPCGEACDVGYLDLPPNSASIKGMRLEEIRRASKHKALVVATRVTGESLAPINAQYFDKPFGPPVLMIAGMHHDLLAEHAKVRSQVTFVSSHSREPARSYNVVARVIAGARPRSGLADAPGALPALLQPDALASAHARPDREHARPPLVLLTPRTGWWESTAERAGGLVAWLAGVSTAASLNAQHRLGSAVHAFATCGHELGHVGLHALLSQEAALLHGSAPWLHLGANLGCASNQTMMLRASDAADSEHMRELLIAEGYPAALIRIEPITLVSGEGRDVIDHGGRVLSLAGSNAHFHAASDRWPGNVSAGNIAAIARAVSRWVAERVTQ